MHLDELHALRAVRDAVGVSSTAVEVADGQPVWAGPLPIDDLAVSCVIAAIGAAGDLLATRNGEPVATSLDAEHAAAAFQSEAIIEPLGWPVPPVWDPIAGDYACDDGWVRLHTNYPHHRRAALAALGIVDRPDLTRADAAGVLARWRADDAEAAVVSRGGVAAAQRSVAEWSAHPASAVRAEPLLARQDRDGSPRWLGPAGRPFDGVRVLDLTRVLAGPTCTGFLAAWGAEVLRIDPPGFPEVPAIVPITTAGKRCAALDLRTTADRTRLDALIDRADVVVHGYRPEALASTGIDVARWHERGGFVEVTLDAYGWTGPWSTRRGFDSIVQHSVGITTLGQHARRADRPIPMPCQALDHGAGWLMAAAVATGLRDRQRTGHGSTWRTSLARVAELLLGMPRRATQPVEPVELGRFEQFTTVAPTAWGPLRRLAWPGRIAGLAPRHEMAGPVADRRVEAVWTHAA